MRSWFPLLFAALAGAQLTRSARQPIRPPRIDERVAQIPQTALGAPWAFIGYARDHADRSQLVRRNQHAARRLDGTAPFRRR